jgi:sigma-B regulation protein RsbU (phosphoserine phosphatase)
MTDLTKMEKLLLHAGRMLNTTLEYEELMHLVLELAIKATDAEAALVYRIDDDVKRMRVRYMKCGDTQPIYFKIPKGEGIIGWVAEHRETQIVHDMKADPRYSDTISRFIDVDLQSAVVVPLIGRGQMIGVVEVINKREGRFDDADLDTLTGLANQFAVAIDNANLYRDAQRRAMEQQLLYEVSKTLSSPLGVDEVLKQILDSLQQVVGFSSGGVYLIDEELGEINTLFTSGYDEAGDKYFRLKIGQGVVGWVARTGKAVNVPDVSKDERYIAGNPGTKSEIAVPIVLDGRVIGVVNLESDKAAFYEYKARELITAFASHAAISIERAKMHDSILEGKSLEEQLKIARDIQLTFLPKKNPQLPGYDIAGVNIPSGEVGGDYFDFIRIIDYQTGISIADVSGKGIPASLIMASFRASLIAEIRNNYAIRTICRKVNSLLYESVEQGNYVTAFYGVLDSKNDIFTFSNCGHNQPILLRRDKEVEFLSEGGPALGVLSEAEYEERPIFLLPEDIILFYTDGVTEAINEDDEEFGVDRLIECLNEFRDLPAAEIQNKIVERVRKFAGRENLFDDLTIVVIKKS